MDSTQLNGIEAAINRINEIQAKIQEISAVVPQNSFQGVLNAVQAAQPPAPEPSTSGNFLVDYKGHAMTAETAKAFGKLEGLLNQVFPGRAVTITSTTDGQHQDPNHYAGKAIDFVVDGLTTDESKVVEGLAKQAGFIPFNEYIYDSKFKTGKNIHLDYPG